MNIKQRYENCVMQYIEKFCKKHELEFEGWIGNYFGEIAYLSDMVVDFYDIRLDIDNNIDKKTFKEYYYYNLENGKTINYRSYLKGAR